MSDSGNSGEKGKFEGPFFNMSKPYLDFIGTGKIFSLVYYVMAAINLLLPIGLIVQIVRQIINFSKYYEKLPAKYIIALILSWLVVTFACWIGFQLWWNRRTIVSNVSSSEFIATPIFSEIFKTFGEWLGTLIAIIGAGVGLIATILGAGSIFRELGLGFLSSYGAMVIVIGPVIGFFIIILTRFLAEQLRIFAAIANNTKEIATKR